MTFLVFWHKDLTTFEQNNPNRFFLQVHFHQCNMPFQSNFQKIYIRGDRGLRPAGAEKFSRDEGPAAGEDRPISRGRRPRWSLLGAP